MTQDVRKIPTTLSLTPRQIKEMTSTARGLGITIQELMRRMVDRWIRERWEV